MSINANEAAADVTAFVSYRNRASHADDDEREMRASQSRLFRVMTPTGLTDLNLRRSARWDGKGAFSICQRGQRKLNQDPGSVCTTVQSGGRIENRAARGGGGFTCNVRRAAIASGDAVDGLAMHSSLPWEK